MRSVGLERIWLLIVSAIRYISILKGCIRTHVCNQPTTVWSQLNRVLGTHNGNFPGVLLSSKLNVDEMTHEY